jgi:hypothetical protein|tara:strand:- start:638 stop:1105 length:468 start_codon:yes stop_codon:yes gene_type:complete
MKSSIKKITEEKASIYISKDDDLIDSPIRFYTITEDEDGWDKITYYTSRRKDTYSNRGKGDQWVYILSNPSLPNMLKIGYTKNEPEVRAKQISASTGVALPYKVEWAFQCFNGEQLEQEVHHELETYRVNQNREFFDIPLDEAQETIVKLGKNYI